MQHFGPKTVLTSIVNDWGPHYIRSAQAVMDGTWKAEDFWGGLAEYGGPLNQEVLPAPVREEAGRLIESIRSGAFHPSPGRSATSPAGAFRRRRQRDQCRPGVDELLRGRHQGRPAEVSPGLVWKSRRAQALSVQGPSRRARLDRLPIIDIARSTAPTVAPGTTWRGGSTRPAASGASSTSPDTRCRPRASKPCWRRRGVLRAARRREAEDRYHP